ncbi:unnamed protein product [Auanema sp. JU1783]|nr:unnamed protein product [Auanema sp. JU1783]
MRGLLFFRSNIIFQCRNIHNVQPVKLSYNIFGDPSTDRVRPPLVILHGLFGQKTNWNSVGKALQRRLKGVVYCVDLRNHGSSPRAPSMTYADMAADVAEFIRDRRTECGFDKVNLLGHSMGGKTAMRLAVEPISASLINKLIVEDVSPKGYSSSHIKFRDYIKAMRNVDLRKTRREILDALEPAVPELAVRQFLITNLQPKGDGSLEWKCNMDVIDKYVEDVLGFSVPSGAFRGKTLFLYGAISGYVPDSDRPLIRCLFPLVEFESIANAGHWVHAEYPNEFIDSISRFLD